MYKIYVVMRDDGTPSPYPVAAFLSKDTAEYFVKGEQGLFVVAVPYHDDDEV